MINGTRFTLNPVKMFCYLHTQPEVEMPALTGMSILFVQVIVRIMQVMRIRLVGRLTPNLIGIVDYQ